MSTTDFVAPPAGPRKSTAVLVALLMSPPVLLWPQTLAQLSPRVQVAAVPPTFKGLLEEEEKGQRGCQHISINFRAAWWKV
jgi:hypothetical protein